jgi:hypothetical protein
MPFLHDRKIYFTRSLPIMDYLYFTTKVIPPK